MAGLPVVIDPVIIEYCRNDNAHAARAYMTPERLIPFFKMSIEHGSQIIFEMCVGHMEDMHDRGTMLQIVNRSLPYVIKQNHVNLLYFLMEKYGEDIKAIALTKDLTRYVPCVRMLDALVWCDCLRYTGNLKKLVVATPVHTEGVEWVIRQAPIEFIRECHDEIEGSNETKKMLAYHYLPGRLLVPGLYMHDINGLDKSIIDRILRLAANSRY